MFCSSIIFLVHLKQFIEFFTISKNKFTTTTYKDEFIPLHSPIVHTSTNLLKGPYHKGSPSILEMKRQSSSNSLIEDISLLNQNPSCIALYPLLTIKPLTYLILQKLKQTSTTHFTSIGNMTLLESALIPCKNYLTRPSKTMITSKISKLPSHG